MSQPKNKARGTIKPGCTLGNPHGLDIRFVEMGRNGCVIECQHANPDAVVFIRPAPNYRNRMEVSIDIPVGV